MIRTKEVKAFRDPLFRWPSPELVRAVEELESSYSGNRYTYLLNCFQLLGHVHNIPNWSKHDLRNYCYTYTIRNKHSIEELMALGKFTGYRATFQCRTAAGERSYSNLTDQAACDLIYLERRVNITEIYPNHFPLGSDDKWNPRWKARKLVAQDLMHITYCQGKVRDTNKVTEKQKRQRAQYKWAAIKMYPEMEPGEAYLRYAQAYYEKQTKPKRKAMQYQSALRQFRRANAKCT
jgi:hypothetical protein